MIHTAEFCVYHYKEHLKIEKLIIQLQHTLRGLLKLTVTLNLLSYRGFKKNFHYQIHLAPTALVLKTISLVV